MKKAVFILLILMLSMGSKGQNHRHNSQKINKELKTYLTKKKSQKSSFSYVQKFKSQEYPLNQTHFDWDGNQWEFGYNAEIAYHSDGRKKYELLKDQFNNTFSTIWYTYDSQNRITEIYGEVITFTGWEPMLQTIYEYNTEGDLIKYEDRFWQNNAWQITNGMMYDITYNSTLGSKSTVESYFNGTAYDTSMKYVEFKTNNIITAEETYQYTGNNVFVPIDKAVYLYENGIDTGILKYNWDGTNWNEDLLYCNYIWNNASKDFLTNNNVYIKIGNDWSLYQREEFSQESNGGFGYLLQDYAGGMWIDNMRIKILNDSKGNRIAYIYDLFLNGGWQQLFKIEEEYTYDLEGNITEHIYKETDSNGDLQPISKDVFSSYSVLGIGKQKSRSLSLYPNPSSDYIYIDQNEMKSEKYSIYNTEGKLIKSGILIDKIEIKNLEVGVYILKTENGSSTFIKK